MEHASLTIKEIIDELNTRIEFQRNLLADLIQRQLIKRQGAETQRISDLMIHVSNLMISRPIEPVINEIRQKIGEIDGLLSSYGIQRGKGIDV